MNKIIHYREKCIGCGICQELQPELWRMSKKDGKANLLRAKAKKNVFILTISNFVPEKINRVAKDCPVKIIKIR